VRVITQVKKITKERKVAEESINVHVLGLHAIQQSAKFAQEGNYTKARMKQLTTQNVIRRAVQHVNPEKKKQQVREMELFQKESDKIGLALQEAQLAEAEEGLNYDSASDDDSSDEMKKTKKMVSLPAKSARSKSRKKNRRDSMSNVLYQAANPMYNAFL
jgi:hypothetical protein